MQALTHVRPLYLICVNASFAVVGVFFSAAEFRVVEGNPPSAGGILDVNINRENKALARDLNVNVAASVISIPSTSDEDVAEDNGLSYWQWVLTASFHVSMC